MRIALVALIMVVAGCDRVFLDAPPGAPEFCDPLPAVEDTSDTDADGVLARDDNCVATKNADQADEDNDCRGDACDTCPWRGDVDSDGPDSDGDGLVDACDQGTSTLLLFDTFNGLVMNRWPGSGGTYTGTFELGMSTFEVRTPDPAATLANQSFTTIGGLHVGLRIPNATLDGTGAFTAGVLVLSFVVPGGITGYRISIARDAGDKQIWFRLESLRSNTPTIQAQNAIRKPLFGRGLRIDVDYGPDITARLAIDSAIEPLPLAGVATERGSVGLTAIGTAATFEYVANVSSF